MLFEFSRYRPRHPSLRFSPLDPGHGYATRENVNDRSDRTSLLVVFQTPGRNWIEGTPYNEQPGFMDHVNYVSSLHVASASMRWHQVILQPTSCESPD